MAKQGVSFGMRPLDGKQAALTATTPLLSLAPSITDLYIKQSCQDVLYGCSSKQVTSLPTKQGCL